MAVDPQTVSLLVQVGADVVEEVIALLKSKGATVNVQSTLTEDAATIQTDLNTLASESSIPNSPTQGN